MSNIQVTTQKDHIINTTSGLKIDMSNIEMLEEPSSIKKTQPRIEIPERRRNMDSDSSDDANDFVYLANQQKFTPPTKEIQEIVAPSTIKDGNDAKGKGNEDEESRRPRSRSRARTDGYNSGNDSSSEYKRRYNLSEERKNSILKSTDDYHSSKDFFSTNRVPSDPLSKTASSFINSSMFTTSKSHAAMTDEERTTQKAYLLQQFLFKNKNSAYSSKRLTMDNDIDEIKNEVEAITQKRSMENNMNMWKKSLLLVVDGAAALNSSYDPFDIDLGDWAMDMHTQVSHEGNYDDVLNELISKYSGKFPVSPEFKLLFMMGSSLAIGVAATKRNKAELKKRLNQEKLMEEKMQRYAQEEVMKQMNKPRKSKKGRMNSSQEYAGNSSGNNSGYSIPQNQGQQENRFQFMPQSDTQRWQQHQQQQRPQQQQQQRQESKMSGPSISMTNDEIYKAMESQFLDSDDSSVASSRSNNKSVASSRKSEKSKGKGKEKEPETFHKKEDSDDENLADREDDDDRVVRISAPVRSAAARAANGEPPRKRGRPRKNPIVESREVSISL